MRAGEGQRLGEVGLPLGAVGGAAGVDLQHDVAAEPGARQVLGLILTRYVLEVEPIASMPVDDLVEIYAPTIQRYLTGPLP